MLDRDICTIYFIFNHSMVLIYQWSIVYSFKFPNQLICQNVHFAYAVVQIHAALDKSVHIAYVASVAIQTKPAHLEVAGEFDDIPANEFAQCSGGRTSPISHPGTKPFFFCLKLQIAPLQL